MRTAQDESTPRLDMVLDGGGIATKEFSVRLRVDLTCVRKPRHYKLAISPPLHYNKKP